MNWIMIGLIGGSIVTSGYDNREACEGRAVMLREKGVTAKCIEMSNSSFVSTGGTLLCYNGSSNSVGNCNLSH
jgi:hypothetical protein